MTRVKQYVCIHVLIGPDYIYREPRWSSGYTSRLSSRRPGSDLQSWLPYIIHLSISMKNKIIDYTIKCSSPITSNLNVLFTFTFSFGYFLEYCLAVSRLFSSLLLWYWLTGPHYTTPHQHRRTSTDRQHSIEKTKEENKDKKRPVQLQR